MKLKWNGHACFTLTLNNGTVIVMDPFNASVGYECPTDRADIVTMSHGHFDHACADSLTGDKKVLNTAGEYAFDGARISTISSFHDDAGGTKRGNNLIFKFEADGETVVHLGDLGHMPNDEQLSFIKGADVMLIPIGGFYTIDTDTAIEIIKLASPRSVIPMHYNTGVNQFPISDEKAFASAMNAVYTGKREIEVKDIPAAAVMNFK